MRQLVTKDELACLRVLRRFGREINFRPEQPREARRRQPGRHPDRNRAFRAGKRPPDSFQSPEKQQILRQNGQRHRCRASQPDEFQNRTCCQPCLHFHGRSFRLGCCLRRGLRAVRLRGAAVFRSSQPLHGGGHVRNGVHHADRTPDQRDRQQKPQRGEQPERVLQARIEFPAQEKSKRGQRKDQNSR